MSPGVYRVEGVRELRAALRAMGDDLQEMRALNTQVASFVGATAAQRAPRISGMLAASWRPSNSKTEASVRFGGAAVPYANAVHWGTGPRPGRRGPHNITPNRFATEAAAATEPTWGNWYLEFIDDVMQRRGLA
ncbi:MAG: hypothetical protein FWF90_16245 [Promicromonosporaceae bacterium]|nr:hypothetical protein [Promicromonosporaceae bacterium]